MKVLLLDADGVILKKGKEYFSEIYAREYGVNVDLVSEFFRNVLPICQRGDADLRKEIIPYLEKWGWTEGVEAYLAYWFAMDFHPDEAGLKIIQKIRENGVKCYMASNNEIYRANYLRNRLGERDILDGYFFSSEVNARKEEPAFFEYVATELGLEPSEITFVDNDEKNIQCAQDFGIDAYLYNGATLEQLLAKV